MILTVAAEERVLGLVLERPGAPRRRAALAPRPRARPASPPRSPRRPPPRPRPPSRPRRPRSGGGRPPRRPGTTPSATASSTPCATPAWAAPHVSAAWRSPRTSALLTKSVAGLTASSGAGRPRRGRAPGAGVASAVAQAVSTGPALAAEHRVHVGRVRRRSRRTPRRSSVRSAKLRSDHPPRDLAGVHGREGLVDLVQPERPRDERVEVEPALHVEVEHERHVHLRPAGAVEAAGDDLLLARKRGAGRSAVAPSGGIPTDDDHAAAPHGRRRPAATTPGRAGRVEGVVGAAPVRQLAQEPGDVLGRRIDGVRGAQARGRVSRLKATGSAATIARAPASRSAEDRPRGRRRRRRRRPRRSRARPGRAGRPRRSPSSRRSRRAPPPRAGRPCGSGRSSSPARRSAPRRSRGTSSGRAASRSGRGASAPPGSVPSNMSAIATSQSTAAPCDAVEAARRRTGARRG